MKHPIFLFGSGRCGSTLVQRILNTHEEIVMWGEHEGFLAPLSRAYTLLMHSPNAKLYIHGEKRLDPKIVMDGLSDLNLDICWINNFRRPQVKRRFTQLISGLLTQGLDLEKVHWGFKEIRYRDGDNALPMLEDLYPQAKVLFLFRNPLDMVSSAIIAWRGEKIDSFDTDKETEVFVRDVVHKHFEGWYEKNSYLLKRSESATWKSQVLKYEDFVAKPNDAVAHLFDFLELDVPLDAIKVISNKVSSTASRKRRALVQQVVAEEYEKAASEIRDFASTLGY